MSSRRAMTLLEVAVYVAVTGVAIDLATEAAIVVLRGQRDGRVVPGGHIDRLCDRMRRELTLGAKLDVGQLVADGHRYACKDAALERDGIPVLAGCTPVWRREGDAVVVELHITGRPARSIRVTVAP